MQALTIDPAIPFLIPPAPRITIAIIGCGGTGSHIAQAAARLAAHCRDTGGPELALAFMDADTVEPKNVGRQLFSMADVGKNKAQALAARFGAVFGLPIMAFPQMLTRNKLGFGGYGILVGAVDNAAGRRALAEQVGGWGWNLWIDCGNHESSGQVVVGNVIDRRLLHSALELPGLCSKLPAASALYPELIKEEPERPRADCAAAMLDNAQSLMVNQMMAAIAAQYLYQVIIGRRLLTYQTTVDLGGLAMRSDPITAASLSQAAGISIEQLRGQKAPKKKGKRAA